MKARILVVDDEQRAREVLGDHLVSEGYVVVSAEDGEEALRLVRESDLNLVLLDLVLPDINGIEVLSQVLKLKPALPVVMISGQGSIQDAVKATRLGAYDFLEKPAERARILLAVRNALERDKMEREVAALREEVLAKYRMVGMSETMRKVFALIDEVATAPTPVLITGESGVGKELVSRAIHSKSGRSDRAFVKLNCAAIPENLIESELFGYEKGAFSGALNQKKGKLEMAHDGTLFLDEVGDLSPASQAKLLRFLQESEFERVGGTETLRVETRMVSATNKDLKREMEERRFREDLYYRLNVIRIHVPPLRERPEDIPVLADLFLARYCEENGTSKKTLAGHAVEFLRGHGWPGNVRELQNLMRRAALLVKAQDITGHDLAVLLQEPDASVHPAAKSLKEATDAFRREHIRRLLTENNGDKTKTARDLGIERGHLYRLLKTLGLSD